MLTKPTEDETIILTCSTCSAQRKRQQLRQQRQQVRQRRGRRSEDDDDDLDDVLVLDSESPTRRKRRTSRASQGSTLSDGDDADEEDDDDGDGLWRARSNIRPPRVSARELRERRTQVRWTGQTKQNLTEQHKTNATGAKAKGERRKKKSARINTH